MLNISINYNISLLKRDKNKRSHIIQLLEEFKSEYKISNSSILELGCGLGQNLEVFRADNRIMGVEGIYEVVEEAQKLGLNVVQQNLEAEQISLPNGSQDLILCLDVLEHLMDPSHLLLEIKRLLAPNGLAILNVPNHLDIRGRLKILFGSGLDVHNYFPDHYDWNNPHIRFFRYKSFNQMIQKFGFEVVKDYSYRNCSIPLSGKISNRLISNLFYKITSISPSLFAGGFFLVIKPLNMDKKS
jgi:2-polyprenyl-3-methyl-5-hydroxy-6-metoxy-1,4-benzoquinol methylase